MGIANTSAAACLMSGFAAYRSTCASAAAQGSMTPGWRESARYWRRRWHFMAITTCGPANRWTYSMWLATSSRFEIAMMAGAFLAAAQARMTVLVDGFIATAALLVADAFSPDVRAYCVFSHVYGRDGAIGGCSIISAHGLCLRSIFGSAEGTGAALA